MSNGAKTRTTRTRKMILPVAESIFLKRGYAGTSMDDIATSAGVSKQTVYAHFQSKEALFLEIVNGLTGGAGDELQSQVADPDPSKQHLEEFLLEFASHQLKIVLTPKLMQLRRLVIGEVERFPELGKALHERGPARSVRRLAQAFDRYKEVGALRVHDPYTAASIFNWMVMGAPVNDAMLLGDDGIPTQPDLLRHARLAVEVFLSAYGGVAKPSGA